MNNYSQYAVQIQTFLDRRNDALAGISLRTMDACDGTKTDFSSFKINGFEEYYLLSETVQIDEGKCISSIDVSMNAEFI